MFDYFRSQRCILHFITFGKIFFQHFKKLFKSFLKGVIYDFEKRTQMVLQGHCNSIVCCAVSQDKRWIVTADSGDDSILVIWDSLSGTPVKTFYSPFKKGIVSVDISDDALFISALGTPEPVCKLMYQYLSIYITTFISLTSASSSRTGVVGMDQGNR